MAKIEFMEKSIKDLCPIALKLATVLCSGTDALQLDEHTLVTVPSDVVEKVKEHAGNPGTIEEIMEYLRIDPWATGWAEGICERAVGRDSPYFDDCVNRMLRKLAEDMREKMQGEK
jgi:hypothetical protein